MIKKLTQLSKTRKIHIVQMMTIKLIVSSVWTLISMVQSNPNPEVGNKVFDHNKHAVTETCTFFT